MIKCCIFLANGFEEGEAINTIDVLRRANINVEIISIYDQNLEVVGSHNIIVKANFNIAKINNWSSYDAFILPGGPGVEELLKSQQLKNIITEANTQNKYICAICAAPKVLLEWNILNNNQRIVHYPNVLQYANTANDPVCIDKNIITGTSIGTSISFALLIVETLLGKAKRDSIEKTLVIK